jgi:hypothetical protein
MNFRELLLLAKESNAYAADELATMYKPLLMKEAVIGGVFDEDLYQELWLTFLVCVRKFNI